MTFNDNANVGGNSARRRGAGIAVGGGITGLGAVAVLLLSLFTGQDVTGLLGGALGAPGQAVGGGTTDEGTVQNCQTGADANRDSSCRLAATSVVLDQYWAQHIDGYRKPQLVIVDRSTPTQCGTASNNTGPFYCPPDETVYIDPTFFDLLHSQFGATAGNLAQLYVIAHEYGHHVQQITGITQDHPANGTGPTSNGVRTELQADCFAGAFIADMATQKDQNGVAYLQAPTNAQIADAINAAQAVGDDHIQKESGVPVNPETWTHGSSAQREHWFETGMQGGPGACDTFSVSGRSL
jgi:predicted metalloprotease